MDRVTLNADTAITRAPAVEAPTRAESSYARLRELIMDAEVLPNTHHLNAAIATRLGVPVEQIEAAAHRLHVEGLVTVEPRGGFWIAPFFPSDVIDAYRQVSKLEARAAYIAALHGPSAISMAALDDAVMNMENSLFRQDLPRWARASHHFHRTLVQCSEQPAMIGAALALSPTVHRARMTLLAVGYTPIQETQNYAFVVEAIRRGAADEARDFHLQHWRESARTIIQALESNGLHSAAA